MIKENCVAVHTFNMLLIADYIYNGDTPPQISKAILYHDLHEGITGDIPWPMKQDERFRDVLQQMEQAAIKDMGTYVKLNEYENRMLKFIDTMELLQFIDEEIKLGNSNVSAIYQRALRVCNELLPDSETARKLYEHYNR